MLRSARPRRFRAVVLRGQASEPYPGQLVLYPTDEHGHNQQDADFSSAMVPTGQLCFGLLHLSNRASRLDSHGTQLASFAFEKHTDVLLIESNETVLAP